MGQLRKQDYGGTLDMRWCAVSRTKKKNRLTRVLSLIFLVTGTAIKMLALSSARVPIYESSSCCCAHDRLLQKPSHRVRRQASCASKPMTTTAPLAIRSLAFEAFEPIATTLDLLASFVSMGCENERHGPTCSVHAGREMLIYLYIHVHIHRDDHEDFQAKLFGGLLRSPVHLL